MLNVFDLFSGIGGFSLGLERTGGFRTVAFCEIEPYCRSVLSKHWPGVTCYGNIKKLTSEQLKSDGIAVDVITGGYPCQPFSVAGKRRGHGDERHLWPEMLRIIRSVRPKWVIAENVAGHIKFGFDEVAASLEAEGFTIWAFVIPACAVDAAHQRNRLWIVANACRGIYWTKTPGRDDAYGATSRWQQATDWFSTSSTNGGEGNLADSNSSRRFRGRTTNQKKNFLDNLRVKFKWPIESGICRVAYGIPHRMDRLRALGNAVVPQIPELVGYAILEMEARFTDE
jgi:DNA (cytosine-5)-methyltransferase 1